MIERGGRQVPVDLGHRLDAFTRTTPASGEVVSNGVWAIEDDESKINQTCINRAISSAEAATMPRGLQMLYRLTGMDQVPTQVDVELYRNESAPPSDTHFVTLFTPLDTGAKAIGLYLDFKPVPDDEGDLLILTGIHTRDAKKQGFITWTDTLPELLAGKSLLHTPDPELHELVRETHRMLEGLKGTPEEVSLVQEVERWVAGLLDSSE